MIVGGGENMVMGNAMAESGCDRGDSRSLAVEAVVVGNSLAGGIDGHTPATKNLNVDDTFSLVVYSKVAEMRRGEKRTTTEIQDKANKAG